MTTWLQALETELAIMRVHLSALAERAEGGDEQAEMESFILIAEIEALETEAAVERVRPRMSTEEV